MSEFASPLRDLLAFAMEQPVVIAACVIGLGGLLLMMGAGRRDR